MSGRPPSSSDDDGGSIRQTGKVLVWIGAGLLWVILVTTAGSRLTAQARLLQAQSVWDGVYSKQQADRGDALYQKECTRCHNQGPMTGVSFMSIWNGRTADDLFQLVKNTMPQDGPGTLTRRNYVDLLAFTFKANDFPAGDVELKTDSDRLQAIRIQPKRDAK